MQQFNFKMIASLIGTLLMIVSLMMLVSLFFSFYYGENWHPMLISSGITFGFGIGLYLLNTKNTNKEYMASYSLEFTDNYTYILYPPRDFDVH